MCVSMALSSWLSAFFTMGEEGESVIDKVGMKFSASIAGIYCRGQEF